MNVDKRNDRVKLFDGFAALHSAFSILSAFLPAIFGRNLPFYGISGAHKSFHWIYFRSFVQKNSYLTTWNRGPPSRIPRYFYKVGISSSRGGARGSR